MSMQELDDNALLREYIERDSERAFATLVGRHVNKVYSIALRHTRNPHHAEEITQAVFVILAKKSRDLPKMVIISGWLCRTAQLTATTFLRSEIRRARREQEAHMQTLLDETESDAWPQIAPLLDSAMSRLSEADHHAIVLRFFDGKSMKEIGIALGTSEDTAKKRVNRAVDKLRTFFTKRGVVLSAAILTSAMSANSVQAAPVVLAKSITAVAITKGAAASGSTLTLVKGVLKVMAWTKAKAAIVVGVAALLVAGTVTVTVGEHRSGKAEIMQQMQAIKASVVPAVIQYAQTHQDAIPRSLSELKPYLPANAPALDDDHWEILASGKLTPLLRRSDVVLLQEKNVPSGQPKIIGYTDGHFTYRK